MKTNGQYGYYVEYKKVRSQSTHVFCGAPTLPGSLCPNCRKPLLHFLSIDTADLRVNFSTWPCSVVPLLFCWTCNVSQAPFSYRVSKDKVAILKYKRGGIKTSFPYEKYPREFPKAQAELVPVTETEAKAVMQLNRGIRCNNLDFQEYRKLNTLRHQVGGEPRLIQGSPPEAFSCPDCKIPMSLFATIADDCLDPRGFTDNCGVQVLYFRCDHCRVIGCRQECD
jgi:hypothetical protein